MEFEKYVKNCPLNEDEMDVLNMRRQGRSIIYIAEKLKMSERTVSRTLKIVSDKINRERGNC